jgi:hypothetical protein
MQPGYPGSGQDPYGQQQPYSDPYSQPEYQQQPQYQQPPQYPQYTDPYAQPPGQQQQPQYPQPPSYQDPYAQPQPTSGNPYPTSGNPYPTSPPAYTAYPVAGYGAPAPQQGNQNVFGILALILGIVSIPAACCYLGLLLGGAAVVLGIVGMKKATEGQATNRGMALAGVICGGVGVVLVIGYIVLRVAFSMSSLY